MTALPKVGIPNPRKKFYSLRNTFMAGYVRGQSVEAMKEAIEKLRYGGFGLKPRTLQPQRIGAAFGKPQKNS
jgi:hypothetical protein